MSLYNKISLYIVASYILLLIAQIWFSLFTGSTMIKISYTSLLIFILNNVIKYFFDKDNDEDSLKNDKYIN
jgi:biotin transporter BioY